jgi:ABC-type bacteriocin/lantibiotic exporter with double-glycine peptidase domain
MQTSSGQALDTTFGMLDSIGLYLDEEDEDSVYRSDHSGFDGEIGTSGMSVFTFIHHKASQALKKISLRVKSGSSLAIVGPSGTGRATLVDVMLGLITADSGQSLKISCGLSPRDAIDEFARCACVCSTKYCYCQWINQE